MNGIIELSYGDLALAALFLLLPAVWSVRNALGIHRDLVVGALRCFGQLIAIGYLLHYVFELEVWYLVAGLLLVQVVLAARIATQRQSRPLPGAFGLSAFSIGVTAFITLGYINLVLLNVPRWWEPRYVIPLAGMVLGNAMNGSALALERLGAEIRLRRAAIEVSLSLGATPAQATAEAVRATVKASLIPTLNGLMSVGLVHLPGMMTGQILSGTAPTTAVRYQILIFYALTFVSAVTAILVTSLAYPRHFTARMQLIRE